MGKLGVVVSLVALALGVGACGSSSTASSSASGLSHHDQAAAERIGGLVATFRRLEAEISGGAIAGSKIHSRAAYVRIERPRIDQLGHVSQQLRQEVSSLDDVKLAGLYDPLAEAIDREAGDLKLFLNSIIQGNPRTVQSVYAQLGQDERQINDVALQQLPKIRAYARQLGG